MFGLEVVCPENGKSVAVENVLLLVTDMRAACTFHAPHNAQFPLVLNKTETHSFMVSKLEPITSSAGGDSTERSRINGK